MEFVKKDIHLQCFLVSILDRKLPEKCNFQKNLGAEQNVKIIQSFEVSKPRSNKAIVTLFSISSFG